MKTFITLLHIALIFTSCVDFLDREPIDQLAPENYMVDAASAETMVNAIYNELDNADFKSWVLPLMYDAMTDDFYNNYGWQGTQEISKGQMIPSNQYTRAKWKWNWKGIVKANSVLEQIDKVSMDPVTKDRLKGEAHFLRAYFYADLVEFYGDVPLITKNLPLDNALPARDPKEKVIKQIYDDCNLAIQYLPVTYSSENQGRATKGAALSLKAKVLLANREWEKCYKTCQQVIDLDEYQLFSKYRELFLPENENNKEVIFAIQCKKFDRPNMYTEIVGWWDTFGPTLSLVNDYHMANGYPIHDKRSGYKEERRFEGRDPRFLQSIVVPGGDFHMKIPYDVPVGTKLLPINHNARTGFKMLKWVNQEETEKENDDTNKILFRYAEILLMYAEARNEVSLSVPADSVFITLDLVRKRAGMPLIKEFSPDINTDDMREVIRHERRIEFVCEGKRMYDLRRWKTMEKVMPLGAWGYDVTKLEDFNDPDKWQFVEKLYEARSFNPARDYLWPIPDEETNSNPNMEQNPYYPRN